MFLYRTSHPDALSLVRRANELARSHSAEVTQEVARLWQALNLEEVGYWRKANAIHGWFVDHVQDGEDDQRLAPVSVGDLQTLRDTITAVLADPGQAPALLPTRDGFFFGSTAYDDEYFADLQDTAKLLDRLLALPEPPTYLYHAWW